MINPANPPSPRQGRDWQCRKGCSCTTCPWLGNCLGETWPHWIQIIKNTQEKTDA